MIDLNKTKDFANIEINENKFYLICLHGGPGLDRSYFRSSLSYLEPDVEAVVYDQGSFVTNPKYEIDELVSELALIYESLSNRTKRVGLLAHSFGGLLALKFLSRHKLEIPSILVSWIYDGKWISLFNKRHDPTKLIEFPISDHSSSREKMENRMLTYIKFYFSEDFQKQGEEILRSIHYFPEWTDKIDDSFVQTADFNGFLDEFKSPILSIVGQNDGVVYPDYYERFKSHKNINHFVINGTKHFPFIEKQEIFRDLVFKYIRQIRNQNQGEENEKPI